jgi:hypothetical protein
VPDTFPAGLGEPINVILTGNSDGDVLKDQETDGGLRNYFLCVSRSCNCQRLTETRWRSFGFSGECLGQHAGSDQGADLGDGNGVSAYSLLLSY